MSAELINRELTAKLLRQLADDIEGDEVTRITVVEHKRWGGAGIPPRVIEHWLTVKWEGQ